MSSAVTERRREALKGYVLNETDATSLLTSASETGASDIFIREGMPVNLKIQGDFFTFPPLTKKLSQLFPAEFDRIHKSGGHDFSFSIKENDLIKRVRINMYRCDGRIGLVARFPQGGKRTFDQLGLPDALRRVVEFTDGFVLLVGPTGSGKTTTLGCFLDMLVASRDGHYLTLEDPIETTFLYRKGVVISQRELVRDFASFPEALKHAMRQAPNIILVGEIRDQPTLALAVNLAETGHLVFSTYHAGSVHEAFVRLGTFCEGDFEHVKLPLAYSLRCIVAQKLLKTVEGEHRMVCEYLFFDNRPRSLFLKNKLNELKSMLPTLDAMMFRDHLARVKSNGVNFDEDSEVRFLSGLTT